MEKEFPLLLLTLNAPLQIAKCTPRGTCAPVWEPLCQRGLQAAVTFLLINATVDSSERPVPVFRQCTLPAVFGFVLHKPESNSIVVVHTFGKACVLLFRPENTKDAKRKRNRRNTTMRKAATPKTWVFTALLLLWLAGWSLEDSENLSVEVT